MPDMKDIVKLAIDAYHGNVQKYSKEQSMDVLRQALIDANGGSTIMNYRAIRDGKCTGLFTLLEEILSRTTIEGLQQSDFFNNFVEFRNVAEGDQNVFEVEDSTAFIVAEIADGTQGVRRQRLSGISQLTIPTSLKAVKIYEEMNRVLSGRVDFNTFISKVSDAFKNRLLEDIYAVWMNATADDFGGNVYFTTAGSYSEDELIELIGHVEAASGKTATILGTKKAVRNLVPSVNSIDAMNEFYHNGYYGSFYGTPVIVTPQRHKIGSTEFTLSDNVLTVVAGESRPIKCVYEGNPLIINGNPLDKGDLTYELEYATSA